jgi:hypothetical protein
MGVADELFRLFVLQDKALNDQKKLILVDELQNSGRSAKACILGIRSLVREDLKQIKIGTLLEAARSSENFSERENKTACKDCHDGLVTMYDEQRYRSLVACNCPRGEERKGQLKLASWNGEACQQGMRGRTIWKAA